MKRYIIISESDDEKLNAEVGHYARQGYEVCQPPQVSHNEFFEPHYMVHVTTIIMSLDLEKYNE